MSNTNTSRLSTSLSIRQAQASDANDIIKGINEICAEGGAFYVTSFILSEKWLANLYHPETMPDDLLLIANWRGQFAGAVNLFRGEAHTLHRHVADLGLFVLRPYRHQGIGTRLMEKTLEWATKSALEKITLSVFANNQPAIHLYQRFGFKLEGCLERHIKSDYEYIDLWLMSRALTTEGMHNE